MLPYCQILKARFKFPLMNILAANRGLISGYMAESKLLTWNEILLRLFIYAHNSEEAKSQKFFCALQRYSDVLQCLKSKLQTIFGVTYDENSEKKIVGVVQRMKYNLITQLLWVEHADNSLTRHSVRTNLQCSSICV